MEKYSNGNKYEGDFKRGKADGRGIYNWANGEIYDGEVTKIMDYGCFVKIEEGIEGLIHNSELDWTNRNVRPNKILSVKLTQIINHNVIGGVLI